MAEHPEYQEQYCAFLDILGFRELVAQVGEDPQKFAELKALLQRVHSSKADGKERIIRSQSISDAIALSAPVSGVGLLALFGVVRELYVDLLCEGYFLRGAIVRGRLYHEGRTMFGSALVKAYSFESEIDKYPRVVVTQEVREDMVRLAGSFSGNGEYPKVEKYLRQSPDGPMYLHVLDPISDLLRKKNSMYGSLSADEKESVARFERIKRVLQERYANSMDTPRHFEKVRWVCGYWNDVVGDTFGLRVHGAGLDIRPGTWGP
jgi:hypothetical protein